MRCPYCDADKDSLKVIDSRTADVGRSIRRRRQCLKCEKRFTTYERIEERQRLTVVKKDGRRVPWDRDSLMRGLERACFKRPVPEGDLLRICDEVEDETFKAHDREAHTAFVGKLVSDKLRRVDQVAYVRFASGFRQFKTAEEFLAEAQAIIDARHYEDDPVQGKLFLDDQARQAKARQDAMPAADGNGQPRRRRASRDANSGHGRNGSPDPAIEPTVRAGVADESGSADR